MLDSGYMRVAAYHASADEADGDELYASTISTDCYGSSGEGAPDLEVEASPTRQDGSPGVEAVRRDGDTSYFSDYAEREVRRHDQAALLAQRPLSDGVKEGDHACSRELLPRLSDDDGARPVTGAAAQGGVGDFFKAEYESNTRRYREELSPVPAGTFDTAVSSAKMMGSATPLKSEGGRRSSWRDPPSAFSRPFLEDAAAAYSKQRQLSEDMPFRHQWPPGSPDRTSRSRFERRPDGLPYRGGPPSVAVREGTVAPSPSPGSERSAATSSTTDQGAPGHRRTNCASSSRASTLATIEAAHVVSVTDVSTNGNGKGCEGGKGASATAQTLPPREVPRGHGASPSHSPKGGKAAAHLTPPRPLNGTATTPMARQTRENDSLMRAMFPALETAVQTGPQIRVVRARPPRGAPLILQCTGHVSTPTRTILVDHTLVEDDDEEKEDTVTAGLHTSAYNETGDRSNLSSPSASADEVPLLNGGERGGSGGCDTSNRLHTTGPAMPHSRTCRAARSASPLLSLTDAQFADGDPAILARQQQPESRHHDLGASPSLSPPKTCEEEDADAMPDLIDFSVHTEGLEQNWQDESLTLCGYSVEPLRVTRDASAPPEICPRHQVPPRHPFLAPSPRSAIAPAVASSNESQELPTALQDAVQLQVGEGARERPQGGAPSSRDPSHLERDGVQVVSRECLPLAHTHSSSHKAHPTGRLVKDLSPASSPGLHAVRHLIESVEETPVPGRDFHPPPWTADVASEGARAWGNGSSAPSFIKPRRFSDTVESVQLTPFSSGSASQLDGYDSLALQQGRRKALCALLDRQTRSTGSSRCATLSHERANAQANLPSTRFIAPAADYVATQVKLRVQRLAAEAERARLTLALDVCEAVRPHARDLLLMLLLLVEESNMRRHHRQRGQVRGCHEATSTHRTSRSSHQDSTVWEESRVTYGTCAEAVNCVLERHGVTRVRATQDLCRRVVAWSQHHNLRRPNTQGGSLLDSLRGTADEASVEYAAFVSSVMEFAAQCRA
ncbi:hypothetical protein LSCM1_07944 [Leishmania martiniquensis]|uniref:Uncharacterized protein n=1 Tax=Leishmania martiniquensis TaxID=1580590 RepID=A0A836H4H0_9TRYP|nr:hypothetical protein LSCM1_07944 [Leishmania martiniquensis]